MIRKTYSLYSDNDIIDQRLAVEIGDKHVAFIAGTGAHISGLEFYEVEEMDLEQVLENIKDQSELLSRQYSETNVYYNLSETVLVPAAQFNASIASDLVDVAFGERQGSQVNAENINISNGIINVYRSPEHWQQLISHYFRAVNKRHTHSALVEKLSSTSQMVYVQFYKEYITVVAIRNKQLQVARNFRYTNDADVLYHVLNVCKQVDIDSTEAIVTLAGFIDIDSSIHQLLRKYLKLKFFETGKNILSVNEPGRYPAHYFAPFFNLLS